MGPATHASPAVAAAATPIRVIDGTPCALSRRTASNRTARAVLLLEFLGIFVRLPTSQRALQTHILSVGPGTKSTTRRSNLPECEFRHGACISEKSRTATHELGRVRVRGVFTLTDGVPRAEGATGR